MLPENNNEGLMKKTGLILTMVGIMAIAISTKTIAAPDQARQQLNNFFTKVTSLKGSFTQQVLSKKGKVIQNTSGLLYLYRPGKFRWIYKTPDPQVIVGDGKNIWLYDEDLEQVTIKPMTKSMSGAPIAILTRKQSPDAQFVVQEITTHVGGFNWFRLTPRKKSNDFKLLEIGLDKSGSIRQMNMFDKLGQKTIIRLNTKSNVPISGKMFTFTPPAGVDVIGKAR
ncbi:MAG TPA: outer membrane lipoprotein chaperone LolA [Leucothrix sp.]|nr:outer membrane lipoprotein chaperone LolA [Leucothrix sp.]